MSNVQALADALKPFLAETGSYPYLTDGVTSELPEDIQAVLTLADTLLITDDGRPDYVAHYELERLTDGLCYVRPGETDSFGWLTGVICTPAGRIVYG